MRLIDECVYNLIASAADPKTRRVRLSQAEISRQIGCHENTARKAARRLQSAGRIKKHGGAGRSGIEYEVIDA